VSTHAQAVRPGALQGGGRPAGLHAEPPRRPLAAARRLRRRALIPAALFLAPMLALYGVYYIYAFVFLGQTSRENVDLSFSGASAAGWRNFHLVLTDPLFWKSIENNLLFAAVQIAVALTLGFFIAVSLSSGVRFRRLFYIAFLLPSLVPLSLFATMFGQLIQTNGGAFNQVLDDIGLGSLAQDWTGNQADAYIAVFVLLAYLIGLPIMYYTSDLTMVNTSVLEAAQIDGATSGQMFRLILFPMLRATHRTVILSVFLGSFRWFELIYFSTNGQPSGGTSIAGTYIYAQMFPSTGSAQIGYASAASVIVLVIAIAVSAVNAVFLRRRS
jgi:raffinose/stachyose/melibiose transport system permease protein